jgi:hypothetical protein
VLAYLLTQERAAVMVDMKGNAVALDPAEDMPSAAQSGRQKAAASGHGRFRVPSVGLDVPLGALSEVDGVLTPPGFTSVYWVRNRGVSPEAAEDGTVFVVTHSLRGGAVGPGNYLIDVEAGRSTLDVGARVEVDGQLYRVSASRTMGKDALPAAGKVWQDVPGRLVIITCLQTPTGTASTQNVVILAVRD